MPSNPKSSIRSMAVVAIVYALMGGLFHRTAIEFDIATLYWPPAGVALACVLSYGYRIWPGVLVGALLSQALSGLATDASSGLTIGSLVLAVSLAVGATFQALVGAYLVRRFADYPSSFTSYLSAAKTLFLAGPVACLVNGFWGPLCLVLSDIIPPADFWNSVVNWWYADTLGVTIFLPLVLIWALWPQSAHTSRRIQVTVMLVLAFASSVAAHQYIKSRAQMSLSTVLNYRAKDFAEATDAVIGHHGSVLRSLEAFHNVVGTMTPAQFGEYAKSLIPEFLGLRAVSWNVHFKEEDRASVEERFRLYYGPDTAITERNSQNQIVSASARPEHVSVLMIEPFDTNRTALGYDVLSNPVRQQALNLARDAGHATATGRISLVQEKDHRYGFLIFKPRFRKGADVSNVEARRAAIEGYYTAVFDVDAIIGSILPSVSREGLVLELQDQSAPPGQQLLFQQYPDGSDDIRGLESLGSFPLSVPGRDWVVKAYISPGYARAYLAGEAQKAFIPNLVISFLVAVMMLVGAGRQVNLAFMVDEKTTALRAETDAREKAEAGLRQAQKLEAVGQLTGGIAHDFNNLLTIIMGNAEDLRLEVLGKDERIATILRATTRGAELTQRLLAFSRQQPLVPKTVHPGALIREILDMFHRTLGSTIQVSADIEADVRHVKVDPGQLENALLNLAINARDAMPDGGSLTIRCANVVYGGGEANTDDVGKHVLISVTDTGEGMSKDVQAQAFDPFFTTKDVGKGSGLGLSMVYGFIKQSKGYVEIDSAVGEGTTIKLYLPAAEALEETPGRSSQQAPHAREGKRVLLVEDDADVRAVVMGMLEKLGCKVSVSTDAASALSFLADHPPIDLLLSDIVLPGGVDGVELVAAFRKQYPSAKCIVMTGYAAGSLDGEVAGELKEYLLKKPFQQSDLAEALQAIFR